MAPWRNPNECLDTCHYVIQRPGVAPQSLSRGGRAHVVVTFVPGPETSAEEPGANGPGLDQRNVERKEIYIIYIFIYSLIYMQSRKSSIYNYCKYALARYKWFWNIKLTQHCSVSQHIHQVQIKQKKILTIPYLWVNSSSKNAGASEFSRLCLCDNCLSQTQGIWKWHGHAPLCKHYPCAMFGAMARTNLSERKNASKGLSFREWSW